MKRVPLIFLLGCTVLASPACAGTVEQPVQDVQASAVTAAPPTATIVWFPPSETPTPQHIATMLPTPEQKPGVAALDFSDDFSASRYWNPAVGEDATIGISDHRLTVAAQPGVYAFRVRQGPTVTNFYAELTARPSLCRDADQYGMLFRSPTGVAYYSFVLSCNGTAWAERVRLGKPMPLHDPVPSSDVPPGAGGEVRLGVWASGTELRFFLNGRYQFHVNDPTYKSGSLGVFARSSGQTPVTVLFSDLSVYDVIYQAPSATPNP